MKKYKITSSDGTSRIVEGNIVKDSIGQDFFGTKEGTEKADDILFAIQAYFGHPEWTYEVARKKCSEKDIQQAIAYVKRKGYNKFNYFDSIKDASEDVIRKLIADEDEAIREYEKAISQFKDKQHFVSMFEDIRDDEMTHRRLLNQMLKHINDSINDYDKAELEAQIRWCKTVLSNPYSREAMDAKANYGKNYKSFVKQDLQRFEKMLAKDSINDNEPQSLDEAIEIVSKKFGKKASAVYDLQHTGSYVIYVDSKRVARYYLGRNRMLRFIQDSAEDAAPRVDEKKFEQLVEYFNAWGKPSKSELQKVVDYYKLNDATAWQLLVYWDYKEEFNKLHYHDSIKDVSEAKIMRAADLLDDRHIDYSTADMESGFIFFDDETNAKKAEELLKKHFNIEHKTNKRGTHYIAIKDAGTKLWQVRKGFAVVAESYWYQYKNNAYVDRVCATLDEAEYVRDSLERNDGMSFCIINCEKGYVRVS